MPKFEVKDKYGYIYECEVLYCKKTNTAQYGIKLKPSAKNLTLKSRVKVFILKAIDLLIKTM